MVEAHSTAACELDEYCWSVIASALTGLNDFHSTYCSLADLLSLAQVCRTTRRAAAVGLKGLDVCRGEAPACPLTRLELRFGESWIFSRSRYGEAATWADISGEVRRDVQEDRLRFADTALFVAVCALAHSSYPVNVLRDHYSREFCVKVLRACLPAPQRPVYTVVSYELALLARRARAQGVAAAEAKKRYGLSDACVRSLPLGKVCFRGRGAGVQLGLPEVMRAAQRRYGCPEGKARAERARRERDTQRRAALSGQARLCAPAIPATALRLQPCRANCADGRAAELAAELAALGLPKAALGDALARRYVRGTWAPSAADAAARLTRRRFLAALPGCAGALRLAACEWACEELGDQAVADRRMAAVEAAAELEALQEWAQRCGSAAAALAAPGLPAGMHAEVAELFTRSAAA